MRRPTPVVLFVYNRPEALKLTLESLKANAIPSLIVYSDGPHSPDDGPPVRKVRDIIRHIDWVNDVQLITREKNFGLEKSIRAGVDDVLSNHPQAVIVEEDIRLARGAYQFLLACLDEYRDVPEVGSATALRYPFASSYFGGYPYDAFFSRRFSSWGWATWSDWWESLEFDNASLREAFWALDHDERRAAGADMTELISAYLQGRLCETWAVPAALNALVRREWTVHPRWNMVENAGFAGGTHFKSPPAWTLQWETRPDRADRTWRLPDLVEEDDAISAAEQAFFDRHHHSAKRPVLARVRGAIERFRTRIRGSTHPTRTRDPHGPLS